jgi:hypothetical protein
MSRPVSVFSTACECGSALEWPASERQVQCRDCKRIIVVEWPNDALHTVTEFTERSNTTRLPVASVTGGKLAQPVSLSIVTAIGDLDQLMERARKMVAA